MLILSGWYGAGVKGRRYVCYEEKHARCALSYAALDAFESEIDKPPILIEVGIRELRRKKLSLFDSKDLGEQVNEESRGLLLVDARFVDGVNLRSRTSDGNSRACRVEFDSFGGSSQDAQPASMLALQYVL